jgi:hypothetical protein
MTLSLQKGTFYRNDKGDIIHVVAQCAGHNTTGYFFDSAGTGYLQNGRSLILGAKDPMGPPDPIPPDLVEEIAAPNVDGWFLIEDHFNHLKNGEEFLACGPLYGRQIISFHDSKAPDLTTHDGITFKGSGWCWQTEADGVVHYSVFKFWQPLPKEPEYDRDNEVVITALPE